MRTPSRIQPCLFAAALAAGAGTARADATSDRNLRCAVRLGIALTGATPDAQLLASQDPRSQVDRLLESPQFIERFARFANATFNDDPGNVPAEDAPYFLAREVLSKKRPWSELFVGGYRVDVAKGQPAGSANVAVTADGAGLGYFRSTPWLKRYAGNELAGLKINTAYRMMHNTIGLRLTATTNAPGADLSATGRKAPACASCHYDGPFALDRVASVLSRRKGSGDNITFTPPTDGPQSLLGGITVKDDKDLVTALVNSDSFRFNTCRLAFQFLTGRAENRCEGPLFDRCMEAVAANGTMQSALAVIARDAGFCQ
jgi:hypothetical protein